jgi:cobalt/nickel transport system permease protein
MGVFSVLAGYAAYSGILRLFPKWGKAGTIAAFTAAWLSVEASAVATAVVLSVSGTFPLYLSLPSLTGVYALVGLGEGIVTAAALGLLLASRPEVLQRSQALAGRFSASLLTIGLAICGILVLLSPYASQAPDGLETVAEAGGFATLAEEPVYEVFPAYSVDLLDGTSYYSTVAAILIGTILVFSLVSMVGQFAARAEE